MNIIKVTLQTYLTFFKNIPYILKISWAWFLLSLVVFFLPIPSSFGIFINIILFLLVGIIANPSIAVAWHQKILTTHYPKNLIYLKINKPIRTYLFYSAALTIMALIPLFLSLGFFNVLIPKDIQITNLENLKSIIDPSYIIFSLAIISLIFIFAKYGLLLPAKAIGNNNLTGQNIEKITKGRTIPIMTILLLASTPMIVIHEPNHSFINFVYGIEKNISQEFDPSKVHISKIKKTSATDKLITYLNFTKLYGSMYYLILLAVLLQLSALSHIYKELTEKE